MNRARPLYLCRYRLGNIRCAAQCGHKRERIGCRLKSQPLLFGGEGENIAEPAFLRLFSAQGKFQCATGFAKIYV